MAEIVFRLRAGAVDHREEEIRLRNACDMVTKTRVSRSRVGNDIVERHVELKSIGYDNLK